MKKIYFLLFTISLLFFVINVKAQITLYSETFGGSTTLPTGWTSNDATNGWGGTTGTTSSGYSGASGSTNIAFANTSTNGVVKTLTFDNSLSTVGYTGIKISWGARATSAFSQPVTFQYSTDGTTWNTVSYTQVAASATWALVNAGTDISLPVATEGVANLRFKWSVTVNNNGTYRLDDFTIKATTGAPCTPPVTGVSAVSVTSITTTTATVNWSNGSGTNRFLILNEGSAPTGYPVSGTNYSANSNYTSASTFPSGTGKMIYYSTSNTVNITNLTSNTAYYGVIYEYNNTYKCYVASGTSFSFNTSSSKSDIISAGAESSCISSLLNNTITTTADGTEVWQFTIRDGGVTLSDLDALPTIINSLVISQGVSNTVSNWTDIQSAALFDGATLVSSAAITSTILTFSGMTYTVPDNSSKTLSLRITLKASVSSPATIDSKIFRFSITAANITVAASGSSGKDGTANVATTDVTKDKVCVVATKLVYSVQPSTTIQNLTMNPAPKVTAYDANNNIDLDFTNTVTITSTGSVLSGTIAVSAISGVATFSSVKHSNTSIGNTLTASSSGFSSIISNTFDIINSATSGVFSPGDFAVIAVNTLIAAGGDDEVSFVVFKAIPTGTQFYMTDCGYEHTNAGKWGNSEGVVRLTYSGGGLPAGTILTIQGSGGNNATLTMLDCNGATAAGWTITKNIGGTGNWDLNSNDQVWFTQGGTWTAGGTNNLAYSGNVLYGWSGIPWKTTYGYASTSGSTLFPNLNCFTTLTNIGSTFFKYTGVTTTTSRLGWVSRLNNVSNWTNYSTNALYAADARNYKNGTLCTFGISTATETDGLWVGGTSTDWFDCNNWDTRVVPNSSVSVTVPSTATRAAVVDNNSSLAYLVGNTADCLDLTIDGKSLSTGASDDIINVNGNFTLQSTNGVLDMTNGGIINIQNGKWLHTAPATFTSGTGTVAFNATNAQTIPAENFNNLTSTSTGDRILASSGTIGIKGTFTQGSNIYTVTGSTVDFNGSGAQNIPGLITINSSPYTNQYNVLKTSNGGTKTTTGDFTILDNIDIGTGSTLAVANEITLKSDATKTARVAPVGGTVSYTTGKFNIERYLPMQTPYSGRRWRLQGVPLSTTSAPTVLAAWQEGATVTSSTTDITSTTNPNPGYGTHITNGIDNSNNANGFDAGSTANPSIYKLEPGATGWTPLTTTVNVITNYEAYMLFARGNRSIVVSSPYINTTGSTNLRLKGRINVGDITKSIVTGKQAISNPYASAISMKNVTYLGTTMATTGKTYYVWDPKLLGSKSVGSWVTFSGSGGTTFTSVPKPADSAYMSVYDNSNGTIESGGAIFLNNLSGSATTMVFHESDKATTTSTQGIASRPARGNRPMATVSSFYTNLAFVNSNGEPVLADGVATTYSDDFNNVVDDQDAPKLQTFLTKEKISLLRNDSILAIERRHSITVDDTIFLQMNKLDYNYNYQLQFLGESFAPGLTAILIDNYLNTQMDIPTEGLTRHNFSSTADDQSINVNRFKVVFRVTDPLPLKFVSVNANLNNNAATVQWKIESELNINHYDVERSVNGIHFTKISSIDAGGNSNYSFVDENATADINYYRIVSISNNQAKTFSNIVNVKRVNTKASISLYSNPLKEDGVVTLQLTNMPLGKYSVVLYNDLGQMFLKNDHIISSRNETSIFRLGKLSSKGVYHLKITKPDMSIQTIKVIY